MRRQVLLMHKFYSNRAINPALKSSTLFYPQCIQAWFITVISLVVPCMYIFTIYVLLKSFNLTVLPRLNHEHLDTIKDDVIEFTKNLKKVSVKYMWFHRLWLIPSFTLGLFFALITKSYIGRRQELALQMSNPVIKSDTVAESKLNNLLKNDVFCSVPSPKMVSISIFSFMYIKLPASAITLSPASS